MSTFQTTMIVLALVTVAILVVLVMRKPKEGYENPEKLPEPKDVKGNKEICRQISNDKYGWKSKVRNGDKTAEYKNICDGLGVNLNL